MRNHAFLQNSKHTSCLRLITVLVCFSLLLSSAGLASASPLMTGEGGNTVYLPIINTLPAWTAVVNETFEGDFPGAWTITSNYSDVSWGKRTCKAASGAYGGWIIGGGTAGSTLPCNALYPNNYETWMVYGPINLSQAQDGMMSIKIWLDTEYQYDYLGWGVSTQDFKFYGARFSGYSNGWQTDTIDLKNVYTLGNVMSRSDIYVGVWFTSDEANPYNYEGAAIDNLVVSTCPTVGGCTGSPTLSKANLTPETLLKQEVVRSLH